MEGEEETDGSISEKSAASGAGQGKGGARGCLHVEPENVVIVLVEVEHPQHGLSRDHDEHPEARRASMIGSSPENMQVEEKQSSGRP